MSLVADYASDGSGAEEEKDFFGLEKTAENDSDSSENEDDAGTYNQLVTKNKLPVLPSPILNPSSVTSSVFSNPFREAEEARASILEKHVKMTETASKAPKKQICWNFRRGRCRFGNKCKYSHDTAQIVSEDNNSSDPSSQSVSTIPQGDDPPQPTKRRRPGLSQTIEPSKKVMRAFHKQESDKKPWQKK